MNQNKANYIVVGLIIVAFISRFLNSHNAWMSNFSPIAAIAIFGTVNFQKKWMALFLPFLLMLITDVCIALDQHTVLFHKYVVFTYGSFFLVGALSYWMRQNFSTTKLLSLSLLSSVLFFVITNFGVWMVDGSGYPKNLAGLVECYFAGIPFFKYTLAGDLFFTMSLFGIFEVVKRNYLVKAQA